MGVLIGSLIGMGILRTPSVIAGYLGNPWLILAIWVMGAIVAILSALVIAEMAAAFPQAGGKYVYAREAFGPVASFVAGWSEFAVIKTFSGAAKAVVIAEYLVLLFGGGSVRIVAAVVILVTALIHLAGIKTGAWVQNITSLLKMVTIAGIAVVGLWVGHAKGFTETTVLSPQTNLLLGLAISYQLVAFTYYGLDDVGKMAEEMERPGRDIPRILLGGTGVTTIIYILVVVAYLSVLTPAEIAATPLPAEATIAGVFGKTAGTVMTIAGILIISSTLNSNFFVMPRVAFALSRDNMAPQVLSRVSRAGTPVPALLFATIVILGLAITGAFEMLVRFYMLVALSVDVMVFFGYFRLRKLRPELVRPFKVPGYPWVPLLTLTLYVLIVAVIAGTQPEIGIVAAAILVSLTVAGMITSRRSGTPAVAPVGSV